MPIKYGKTVIAKDRNTGKLTTTHEYIKQKPIKELIDAYNKPVVPKLRQKVKNELVRRGGVVFEVKQEPTGDITEGLA
tara:strand:- start:960 stop:1193 length:234 start_codon:yes stop_codon:yes gene_type:complete